jgi:cephalosporin-C deacetylase-like acetyl esterase
MFPLSRFLPLFGAALLWPASALAAPTITVTPEKASGIYHAGDKITWDVKVAGDEAAPVTQATYNLKRGGATPLGDGKVDIAAGAGTINFTADQPGTILVEVRAQQPGQKPVIGLGGAAIDPDKIAVSMPAPDDFDAFWKGKLDDLAKIPENAVLEKGDSGNPAVDYYKIQLDNINGTHVYGQLARPTTGDKFPAILLVQYAGVYPLQKPWAVNMAAQGWLVLNIMAHDLPIDQPPAFYDALSKGALKWYPAIGNDDKDKSYFVRMFTGDIRAANYLAERPDWDGKTLVVSGASQGGLQSLVTAALDPKITDMIVVVPAGCDNTGALAGRKPGWPYWLQAATDANRAQLQETSRYFDGVNFAERIKCPCLFGVGLIDTTACPSGVFAAFNQISGPKEIVVMPNANHRGTGNSQAPFRPRQKAWLEALKTGATVPPPGAAPFAP